MASLAALGGYGSEEEAERAGPPPPAPSAQLLRVPADPAPPVCTLGLTLALSGGGADGGGLVVSTGAARTFVSPHAHSLSYNPRVADLYAPVSGPQHPLAGAGRGGAASAGNHPLGFVESAHLGEAAFDEQMHTFNARGFAAEPGGGPGWVGDAAAAERHAGAHVSLAERKRKSAALMAAAGEAGAAGGGGAGGPGGVWAAAAPRSAKPLADHAELTPEQAEYVAWHNARREARRKKPAEGGEAAEGEGGGGAAGGEAAAPEATTGGEKTHFHGKSLTTYAGDSWLAAPKDGKRPGGDCFLPKQWARSLAGHTQGCAAIRFFPSTGHLLLSAGMDHKAKVWDVAAGKLMRTYMGHSGALKDASFSADGARFVTASFDRDVKLWDTETGKVVQAVSAGCVANCVRLHPDRPNTLLAGLADRRVAQWDMASGDMTQEYVEHLQGVRGASPRKSGSGRPVCPSERPCGRPGLGRQPASGARSNPPARRDR